MSNFEIFILVSGTTVISVALFVVVKAINAIGKVDEIIVNARKELGLIGKDLDAVLEQLKNDSSGTNDV